MDQYSPNMNREQFFAHIGTVNRYSLLDRMRSDCEYYLGIGNRYAPHLWAGEPAAQIRYMKWLWESFSPDAKPEWLTMAQIEDLERRMA